ncbi:MAG: DUF2207 domain-containing protein, partial [Luteimonas sp.]
MWRAWLLLVCLASPAVAQERILRHEVDVRILADGRLDVTERIALQAEGKAFRHGLVRDLPLRGRDLQGDTVIADIEVVDVLRDGRAEPWNATREGRVLRLRTGDARHLQVPSQPVYTLRYRTRRQPLFGDGSDAVSMQAIGSDQPVPVERAIVTVSLPGAVPVAAMRAVGVNGADGRDFHVALSATGSARWTTTRDLRAHEGLQVRLEFPAGLLTPPTPRTRVLWWLDDHVGLLLAIAGLLALVAYCVLRWRRVRQPQVFGSIA